ncbi:uncharacterized protein LOC126260554 [Schistocerca nitens]|uniref:uncharacterized protein LOC126260554 n=1 Tax=Schistocerca nitens TaxID=7011 RepID=UPI00211855DC|nr:uncharacterized protein LOC126260554 [Schistocerca nitens]
MGPHGLQHFVLLGLRTAFKPNIEDSPAELAYRESLCLPGEFVDAIKICDINDQPQFLHTLQETVDRMKPMKATRHGQHMMFMHKDLDTCTHVILRTNAVKLPLQPPYTGPYRVLRRSLQTMDSLIMGKQATVSMDRVKSAYMFKEAPTTPPKILREEKEGTTIQPPIPPPPHPHQDEAKCTTRSGRCVLFFCQVQRRLTTMCFHQGGSCSDYYTLTLQSVHMIVARVEVRV